MFPHILPQASRFYFSQTALSKQSMFSPYIALNQQNLFSPYTAVNKQNFFPHLLPLTSRINFVFPIYVDTGLQSKSLSLFLNQILIIRAGIHKMLVRKAYEEDPESDLGLHCLARPFLADTKCSKISENLPYLRNGPFLTAWWALK